MKLVDKKLSATFFLLVIFQGLHSIEEYFGKLWDVFPPARFLTSLISNNLEIGFLIINIAFFIFGIWCWLFPLRKGYASAAGFIWLWVIIEMINGIGHPLWALFEGRYEPGVITALPLLVLSIYSGKRLVNFNNVKKV